MRTGFDRSACLLIALMLTACLLGSIGCGESAALTISTDPNIQLVQSEDVVFEVPAEGTLQAVQTTPLVVPDVPLDGLTLSWMLPQGTRVEEGEVVAEFDPSEAERLFGDEEADHEEARIKVRLFDDSSSLQERIQEKVEDQARIDLDRADVELQSKDPRVSSKNERIEAELGRNLAQIKLGVHEKKSDSNRDVGAADREILRIAEERTAKELELAERALSAMQVKAPHGGIVVFKNRWGGEVEIGEALWPGDPFGEIPDLSEFEVKCYVLEKDGAMIRKGQSATILLDALPGAKLEGLVKSVGKVAAARDRRNRSPVKYFELIVSLKEQDPEQLRLGMQASIRVVAGRHDDVLTIPRFAVKESSGKSFVYVLVEDAPVRREVELGPGDRERVVVVSGLEEGDSILLGSQGETEEKEPETAAES